MITKMATKKSNKAEKKETQQVVTSVTSRGRTFEGVVIKKFPLRVVIEKENTIYVPKYERFYKKKMRLHARLPTGIDVEIGDLIRIQECRPLSKIIHAVVVERIKTAKERVRNERVAK
jgi:small subunit ribosomal protein S17